jgi:MFS transporter, putative metabolite:H+ symporter
MMLERVDDLPLSRAHWRLAASFGAAVTFNGMTLAVLPLVVVALRRDWALTAAQAGVLGSMTYAGGLLGGLLAGRAASVWGRKAVFIAASALVVGASAAAAAAPGLGVLLAVRLLAGVGMMSQLAVVFPHVMELSPKAHRAKLGIFVHFFWPVGTVLGTALGYLVIPALGWRAAVGSIGVSLIYVAALPFLIPESPRFLLGRGRNEEAEAVVRELEAACGRAAAAAERAPSPPPESGPASTRALPLLMGLLFVEMYSVVGLTFWIPSILVASGLTAARAFALSLAFTTGQLAAPFLSASLVDRLGRKPTIAVCMAGACAACLCLALAPALRGAALVCGFLLHLFLMAGYASLQVFASESFPTARRTTAVGAINSVGQLAGCVAPFVIGWLMQSAASPRPVIFGHVAALWLLALAALLGLGEETRGRTL